MEAATARGGCDLEGGENKGQRLELSKPRSMEKPHGAKPLTLRRWCCWAGASRLEAGRGLRPLKGAPQPVALVALKKRNDERFCMSVSAGKTVRELTQRDEEVVPG